MVLFKSRSQLSLSFFFWFLFDYLARSYTTGLFLILRFFILILFGDIIRVLLNWIISRLTRIFIRGITYLSVRSLNLLIMKIAMENIIGSNMKRVFIGCYLEYFCSELMTRFWRGHLVDTCRRHLVTLFVFFEERERWETIRVMIRDNC